MDGPDARIASAAERQGGAIAAAQAWLAGLSPGALRWRIGSGRWRRRHVGVYVIAGSPRTWDQLFRAALLAAGLRVWACRATAAALWELEGFPPGRIEFVAVRWERTRAEGIIVHESRWLADEDVTMLDGVPVTTVARTLLDLCAEYPEEHVAIAMDDALRRRLVSFRELEALADRAPRRGLTGARMFRALVAERAPGTSFYGSVAEWRLLRALRRLGLEPHRQYEVTVNGSTKLVDLAFPNRMLAVEADSYRWHGGAVRWAKHVRRENALGLDGWFFLRYPSRDIRREPLEIAGEIARAYADRGP